MKGPKILHLLLLVAASVALVEALATKRVNSLPFPVTPALDDVRYQKKPEFNRTFTVITADDNGDNGNPIPGSLRDGIVFLNSKDGIDTIIFNIPGPVLSIPTIKPRTPLPEITGPLIIDGTTQGIFGLVELDG